jgi:O-antigen ligase
LLIFALFFSLTRAAWLAYGGALIAMAIVSKQGRKFMMLAVLAFAALVFMVYQLGGNFANIVVSRFALEGGASGSERLDKVADAFISNGASFLQITVGHGWATNLYLHSVPLQLIYEIGVVGFLIISGVMFWAMFKLFLRARRNVPGALPILGCLMAFSICSGFHHTLYHMQTWFIVGLTLYIAFSEKSSIKAKNIDHENSLSRERI